MTTTEPVVAGADITWLCCGCRQAIADGSGYLSLSAAESRRYHEELTAWRERFPSGTEGPHGCADLAAVMAHPAPARWMAWCSACDPQPDAGRYDVAIERIRTAWQALEWTAHLVSKAWVCDETDWVEVARRASTGLVAGATAA